MRQTTKDKVTEILGYTPSFDMSKFSRIRRIWANMKSRCYNSNNYAYKYYGQKGICVCNEWLQFPNFVAWAFTNGYADNLTIDRINGEGNYEPSNCRWASYTKQANNTKANVFLTLNGRTHTFAEWGRIVGIKSTTLQQRKYAGWSDERTLTIPVRRKSKKYLED